MYTDTGHIHVRKHFGKATCLIKEEVDYHFTIYSLKKKHIDSQGDMFYVLGDGCLDAVVKKGDVDLRCKIFSGTN